MANTLILFRWNRWVAFALHCRGYSHFCSKNIYVSEITLATTTIKEFVINKFVKLMMLWRFGPRFHVEENRYNSRIEHITDWIIRFLSERGSTLEGENALKFISFRLDSHFRRTLICRKASQKSQKWSPLSALTPCRLKRLSHTIYWKIPISILGTSGYEIYIFLDKNGLTICKQWRPLSDAAFCSVWSGSALFASYSFTGLPTTTGFMETMRLDNICPHKCLTLLSSY